MVDPRALTCAQGESALQAALHRGRGNPWVAQGDVAWAPAGATHPFLYAVLTLGPTARIWPLASARGTVCDSFALISAQELPGRRAEPGRPWLFRAPGRLTAAPPPPRVLVRRVVDDADVAAWERTVFAANGAEPAYPGELHPPGSQRQPGLTLFLAEEDARPVGAALGLDGPACLTLSAVCVLPGQRGRGTGAALAGAVLALAPHKPATLSTSPLGHNLYRRLGFQQVGVPTRWT